MTRNPEPLGAWGQDPRHFDPSSIAPALAVMDRFFGPDGPYPVETTGAEHLAAGPVLVVGNHSGGVVFLDGWGFAWWWGTHMFPRRPMGFLAHKMFFVRPRIAERFATWGAVEACPDTAMRILRDHGRDALVLPGGDVDVFRPYRERHRVCFDGRRGYARIALRAGVPIVPMANTGAHASLIILRRGRRLAKAMRWDRAFRAHACPVSLTFPWGLTFGPVPHVPVPVRLRYRFGPPVELPKTWRSAAEPSAEAVEELDRRVRAATQEILNQLACETPSLGERLTRGLRR